MESAVICNIYQLSSEGIILLLLSDPIVMY